MMNEGVSIVICTYNGAQRLPDTLYYITKQKVKPGIPWEVIIVDNASRDNSGMVAAQLWNKYGGNTDFSIVHQPLSGLTYARETGIEKAKYNFILMCDDDNWLAEDYVNLTYEIMQQNPRIGILGGKGELVYETEPPIWAKTVCLVASGPQSTESGKVESGVLYGAGSIIRKSVFVSMQRAGFRSLLTDRSGERFSSGGDYELCFAIGLAGYEIWYDERLTFKHFIAKERLTWEHYIQYIKESSECFEMLEAYKILHATKNTSLFSFYFKLLRNIFYYLRNYVLVFFNKLFYSFHSDKRKIARLKLEILKTSLASYRKISKMKQNFLKISESQKKVELQKLRQFG